jgi:hypothetical protein
MMLVGQKSYWAALPADVNLILICPAKIAGVSAQEAKQIS